MPTLTHEQLYILIALTAGEISEGQASILLGMDYIDVREHCLAAIAFTKKRWRAHYQQRQAKESLDGDTTAEG